jgi:hypothetical protein
MSRIGKIARLPSAIRQTLDERLDQGEPSSSLLKWLNSEKSVIATLQQYFDGRHISEANLSKWRIGGHRDWHAKQAASDMFRHIMQTPNENITQLEGGLIDRMATVYAAQLLGELENATAPADDAARAKMWREFRLALVSMRRYQFATVLLQSRLKPPPTARPNSAPKDNSDTQKRMHIRKILGVAGGPDADVFDLPTQTWSGPNAAKMNREHRKLLLEAAREAGIRLGDSVPDDAKPQPANTGTT